METAFKISDADGEIVTFTGAHGRGVLWCREVLPLSIAWPLKGNRLGDNVTIDDPVGKWLESATIVSTDADPTGTWFELSY